MVVIESWLTVAVQRGLVLGLVDGEGMGSRRRFYRVYLQDSLFGGVDVVRQWGRLGTKPRKPRQLVDHFDDEDLAIDGLRRVLGRRHHRGYVMEGGP